MKAEELITDLINRTHSNLNRAQRLLQLPGAILNKKPAPDSWSALECIEHLNRYGQFYLPEINRRIKAAEPTSTVTFRSGWLGNYFAKSMLPKPRLNKMKTFSAMDPAGSKLDKSTLDTFIDQQHRLLDLLDRARRVDITKTKTAISITRWIKLRLGDTFRVVIYHNQRHLDQAERAVANTKKQVPSA